MWSDGFVHRFRTRWDPMYYRLRYSMHVATRHRLCPAKQILEGRLASDSDFMQAFIKDETAQQTPLLVLLQ